MGKDLGFKGHVNNHPVRMQVQVLEQIRMGM